MNKKRFLALILTGVLTLGLAPAAGAASIPAGSGTAGDPFRITNAEELAILGDFTSSYFVLMNNITLPADWEPVGRYSSESPTEADFQGVLDG